MTKSIGDKVLGWFIVDENAPPAVEAADPPPARVRPVNVPVNVPVPDRHPPAPILPPGQLHDARAFAAVYRSAGVADDERDRLTKVLALVESLPSETSVEVKRSIVGASLEAFGISIDRILVTAEGAAAALDGYVVTGQNRTRDVLGQAEARIAKLNAEIEEVRGLMDVQVSAQQELARATTTEKARLRVVLDFFDANADEGARQNAGPRLVRLK